MEYEILARKWRPQVFEEVIGQEHVTRTLKNAQSSGRLAHAYLFTGSRGIGKTSIARILAKALNCPNPQQGNPCNECNSCKRITNSSSVDVHEIDGASNRGIDEIRNLRENIKYMPSEGRYRIYIIDEVHMLTLPAFNALLKTLEEPPDHAKFIFATTEPHKVPVTILSRCQRFDFKRITIAEIEKHLGKIVEKEGLSISKKGISTIAREAEGSMRDAESLLDQVASFTGPVIEDGQITDVLGLIDREIIHETTKAVIEGDINSCLEIINEIYNHGYEIKQFYQEVMKYFRNLIVSIISKDSTHLLDLPDNELEETKNLAQGTGMERLMHSLNFLISRESDIRYTSNPRIALEAVLIKLARIKEYLSFSELMEKIQDIEKRLTGHAAMDAKSPEYLDNDTARPLKEVHKENGKKWDDFLNFISSKNRVMANLLKENTYKFDKNTLELTYGEGSFTKDYFEDPKNHEQLVSLVREFFHPDLEIKLKRQKIKKSPTSRQHPLPDTAREIIEIFEGKIE